MPNFDTDNGTTAWLNWLAQFRDSPRLEAVVKGMYAGMDSAARAAAQLYLDRWLDTARGKQLDGIGQIVGQDRIVLGGAIPFFGFLGQTNSAGFGRARMRRDRESDTSGELPLLDAEYRQAIRWKIAVNKGSGTAPDIAEAINAIFATQNTRVQDQGNAKVTIIVDVQMDPDNPLIANREQWVPTAAGVGFEFAGFRQFYNLVTEDGDQLITDDGDPMIAEVYDEGL